MIGSCCVTVVRRITMRAIRVHEFGGPEVLKLEENVPMPSVSDNEVLVRVMAAGVNPVDTYIRQGTYTRKPNLPYVPGMDAAGFVEQTGEKVRNFKIGDRVFCTRSTLSGCYAEFAVFPENAVFPLAPRLSFSQGAAIGAPYFTAYRALVTKAKGRPSESVLIHGASGAVGLAAVQIARAQGLTVLGTAGTTEGLRIVREDGAHHVFTHKDPGYTNKIMEAVHGEGVDIILEMLSNVNLGKDLNMLKQFGRVVVVGSRGNVEINPRLLMTKESSIIGVALMTTTEEEWKEMAAYILQGIEAGWLTPRIDKEYPLERVASAHEDIIQSAGARGKLILSVASQC